MIKLCIYKIDFYNVLMPNAQQFLQIREQHSGRNHRRFHPCERLFPLIAILCNTAQDTMMEQTLWIHPEFPMKRMRSSFPPSKRLFNNYSCSLMCMVVVRLGS